MSWMGVELLKHVGDAVAKALVGGVGGFFKRHLVQNGSEEGVPDGMSGPWYCGEFDPKGISQEELPRMIGKTTLTKVTISREPHGMVKIKVDKFIDPPLEETKWVADCKIGPTGTLVGTWRSEVDRAGQHGALVLKFMRGGHAVGYWLGDLMDQGLCYGYMVLSESEQVVRDLGRDVHREFPSRDIYGYARDWLGKRKNQ